MCFWHRPLSVHCPSIMILILLLILNNSSVGHTRAELKSKPTAIPCQNNAILSVDYKLSIILGRRRPEQWRGWDGKVFTNKARWKYAYCIEGRQVEYKCGLLTQYLSMNFATWWCSTTLYNVLNDAFQALIAFIVPISFKFLWVLHWNDYQQQLLPRRLMQLSKSNYHI